VNQELAKTSGVLTLFTYLEVILTVYLICDTYLFGIPLEVVVSFLGFIQYFRFYEKALRFLFPAAYTC